MERVIDFSTLFMLELKVNNYDTRSVMFYITQLLYDYSPPLNCGGLWRDC